MATLFTFPIMLSICSRTVKWDMYEILMCKHLCKFNIIQRIFQITLIRNKLKAIDQEPLNELFENELRNETDARTTNGDHHLETHESITFN